MADTAPKTSLKDQAAADLKTVATDALSWWDWAMSYIPAGWKKYLAIAVVVLLGWHYFDALWSFVPAKEAVTPATVSDLSQSLSGKADEVKVAGRLESQTSAIAQLMANEAILTKNLAAQSGEMDDLKTKLDAVADDLTLLKTAKRPVTSVVKHTKIVDPVE